MANSKSGQTLFSLQAPAAGIYRVGPVGSKMLFTSIQSAIDQAVADGFTSNDNLAIVEVYPGTYTENLTLKPGVSLTNFEGVQAAPNNDGTGGFVRVVGNATYSPVAGSLAQNAIAVIGINMSCLNGVALTYSGTAPARLTLSGLSVQKDTGGDANPVVRVTNSGAGSQFRCQNNTTIIQGVAAQVAMDLQSATTDVKDRLSSVSNTSGGTILAAADLSGTATLNVLYCQNFFSGAATQVFRIGAVANLISVKQSLWSNTLAGGHGVTYVAAGTFQIIYSQYSVNNNVTGYLAKDGGGGIASSFVQSSSNVITGTNRQVQIPITVTTFASAVVPTA